jgi:hypothetical protein
MGMLTRVWPALLTGTVAWSVHLVVSYHLAWAACAGGDGWLAALHHLATAAAVASTLVAWRQAHLASGPPAAPSGHLEPRDLAAQRLFLARLAGPLNAMLLFSILMAGAANLVLVPCL